ncbi:aldo/keto reductase family oxidoreductase [soil metagenome]
MTNKLGGDFRFPGTDFTVKRMGYGAMQLSGPEIYGPPKDMDEAIAVLHAAMESGVNHIDTSDYYGPHITNQIIAKALHPYKKDLVIVSKIGAKRGTDKSWQKAMAKEEIISAVHDNLRNLKIETIDIVNLRLGDLMTATDEPFQEQLTVLIDLKKEGLIRHLGLSTVSEKQIDEALKMTEIVCVQNMYNIANRADDELIDSLAKKNIAYVPYFPLGGFVPLQVEALSKIAASLNTTPMQVALAWLLRRSPNILLIPGTSSRKHLQDNLDAANIELADEIYAALAKIGRA